MKVMKATVVLLPLGLAWMACDADKPPAPDSHAANKADKSPNAASAKAASVKKPAVAEATPNTTLPKTKAFTIPKAEDVGTLPEGIGLKVGSTAPTVEAKDNQGRAVRLHELAEEKPVLLVFYRGGWCPYCNFQMRALSKAHKDFEALGVQLVAISVDAPQGAQKTKSAWEIPFPVLSDPQLAVHGAYKVVNKLDDATVEKLARFGYDIEAESGEKHHVVAHPAIFLIDSKGTIQFAHAEQDYKTRPDVSQLLAKLKSLPALQK